MEKLRFLAAVLFVLSSCSKNDPPAPPVNQAKKILKLTIAASYPTSKVDNWVILHDMNGNVIDYRSFESGAVLNFESEKDIPGQKVTVTFFEYTVDSQYLGHELHTYLLNEVGQDWTLKKELYPNPPIKNVVGYFDTKISNVTDGSAYHFSNKNYYVSNSGSWSGGTNILENHLVLLENEPDYFFYIGPKNGIPKYQILRGVTDNSIYNLDVQKMKNYDQTIKVNFSPTYVSNISYSVYSIESLDNYPNRGFMVSSNFSNLYFQNDLRSEITLGYLDTFPTYKTTVYIGDNILKYGYEKVGSKPTSINLPTDATFTIKNKSFGKFSYEQSQTAQNRSSAWSYNNYPATPYYYVNWIVTAQPNDVQNISELPVEIISKYPSLNLDKLVHRSSTFTTQGNSYLNEIDYTFKGKTKSNTFENYTVSVN